MEYSLDLGCWNGVFAVPCALVDQHLKLAGKEQLQVILWVLRHSGQSFSEEELANALSLSQDSVLDALDYWVDCGLLAKDSRSFSPAPKTALSERKPAINGERGPAKPAEVSPAVPSPAPTANVPEKPARMIRPDSNYLAVRIKESEEVRWLMQEAEATLGKTLSPALTSALIAICDDYGLPVEVVRMILSYAKSVGKTGTAYIESVARDWAKNNIFTLEAAENKLKELDQRQLAWKKVESATGIPHRSPTKKEEETAFRWIVEWKFSPEMVAAAYERCADSIGKFSMAYMNKILERWQKLGFVNLMQVQADEQRKKAEQENNKSYDLSEYERMSYFDPPEDL